MKPLKSQASPIQVSEILSRFRKEFSPSVNSDIVSLIAERIKFWAGPQPELTHILCDCVLQYRSQITESQIAGSQVTESQVTEEKAVATVDFLVNEKIAGAPGDGLAASHFNEIEQIILQDDRRDSALISYLQILQRGKLPVSNGPEQSLLLRAGLVKAESGYLKVATALYKKVFDRKKIEQMLPGITKPVVVVSAAAERDRYASKASTLYSKAVFAACGLAVIGASISSYIRESGGKALATSSDISSVEPASFSDASNPSFNAASANVVPSAAAERALFDRGEEHAINSRWVLMMREFCDIPEASMYFSPAQKQVEQLSTLYSEDIKLSREIVQIEKGTTCSL